MKRALWALGTVAGFVACNVDAAPPEEAALAADAGPEAAAVSAPPCANGKRDPNELGVDCGPTCGRLCDGDECAEDVDCVSRKCTTGQCAATPGKTCGVGLPNPCPDGDTCGVDADCASDYCDVTCKAADPGAHEDGRRNAGETGKDCGGAAKDKPCPEGEKCSIDDDCISLCTATKTCDAPSATDGKKNAEETDIDCGGPVAPKCALEKTCATNADCELDACTGAKCVVPTSTDGIKNGGETDIDCGGAGVTNYTAPRCAIEKTCAAGSDCLAGGCTPQGKCALPSCATAETSGIDTCGAKETGEAGAAHESCCRSLVLPTRTTRRLDKYEITAGRFRTFLNAVGPDIRAWVATYVAAKPTSQLAQRLLSWPVLAGLFPAADLGDNLSVTAHMSFDIDNYNGTRGCFNADGAYSANTYWQDDLHQAEFGLPSRSLPRSVSDEKSLNCAQPIMFAAFCAWDGGELAVMADYVDVWPASQSFPWGNTNHCADGKPCDAYNWCNGGYGNGGFVCQNLSLAVNGEPGVFYEYPLATDRAKDNSPLIAAPGRLVKDATLAKSAGESWYDVMANLVELTGDWSTNPDGLLGTFCDMSAPPVAGKPTCTRGLRPGEVGTLYGGIPQVGAVGWTWEGHQYGKNVNSTISATFQYGKFGARCARPAAAY